MSREDAEKLGGGLVGLGSPKPAATPSGMVGLGTPKPAAPASGMVGLGTPKPAAPASGMVGLGTPKPAAPAAGMVGLGSSKPAAPAAGMVGLGASTAPAAAPAAPAPAKKKAGIAIDASAAERIRKLVEDRGTPDAGLRIRVRGGGCTGLQYDMEFADTPAERDRVFAEHGVKIFVDPKSYIFLIGTELTYQSGLLESGFKLENPNVKKACGCGESFTV